MNKNWCIILAKGHSTRLPNKNKLDFFGMPLYRHAVNCAKLSGIFDNIIVDTDDEEIKNGCCDVEVNIRDESVRGDGISSVDVILKIPNIILSKTITLLQPTSPLRTNYDVIKSFKMFCDDIYADSLVSVVKLKNADRIYFMSSFLEKITLNNSQCCVTNGAIWMSYTNSLFENRNFITEKTIFYEMPKERSVDIDTYDDFVHASALWEKGYGK